MNALKIILNRLKEPSTYAGLAGILALVGVNLPAEAIQYIVYVLSGVAGVASILIPEAKK